MNKEESWETKKLDQLGDTALINNKAVADSSESKTFDSPDWNKQFDEKFSEIMPNIEWQDNTNYLNGIKSFINTLLERVIDEIPEVTKDFGEALDFNEKDQTKFSYAVLYHNVRIQTLKKQLRKKYGITTTSQK